MKTTEAIAIFGNKVKVAEALGLTKQAISAWGEEVPPLRVYQIREFLARRQADQAVSLDD